MTENEIRAKVVSTAKKYLGCNEKDGSHHKIIDKYNSHTPLARGYKMTYVDPWCATFVSTISIELGLTDIMPTECSCGKMIELYQKLGRWQESDAYAPKIGDILFYDWQDKADYASTDNKGASDHVGIVIDVKGTDITVIEGNKNDAVETRTVKINGRFIRGYGLPKYSSKATATVVTQPKSSGTTTKTTTKCPYAEPTKNIRYPSKGNDVCWLQWYLNRCGSNLKVDGNFGPLTKSAVLKFQKKYKLTTDGIVGPKTRAKLKSLVK